MLDLDKKSSFNWLEDNFWPNKAYFEVRTPLPIHSNWWLLFKDDPSMARQEAHTAFGSPEVQVARAAWLTWRLVLFRDKLHKLTLI